MPTNSILVVDDEPDVQALYENHFRREIKSGQYVFFFAPDGQEALDRLNVHPEITVVLADINMPRMDGLTLLKQIHQQHFLDRQFQFVRVIMVTAYGDMPNIRKALNHGAIDFLTKPIDLNDLELTINKTIVEVGKLQELERRRREEEQRRIAAEQKLSEINSVLSRCLEGGYGRY